MNKSLEDISTLCDTTMDKVVNYIFLTCDTQNTGYVKVSALINIIEPFLKENMAALLDLKLSLDPNEEDPSVSLTTVNSIMTEWSVKMKESEQDLSQVNITLNEEKSNPIAFSTPLKPLSLISLFDETDTRSIVQNFTHHDAGIPLSMSMNDLLFQYRKMKEETELVRNLQNLQEETMDKLNKESKELNKEVNALRRKVKDLEREKEEYEDLAEMLSVQKLNEKQLNRCLEKKQKELDELEKNIENLEREKDGLNIKMEKLMREHREDLKIIAELETVVNVKETEIESLQNKFILMQEERDEQKEFVRHIVDNNVQLQTQKETYEKCLLKTFNKTTAVNHRASLPLTSSSTSSSSSSVSSSGRQSTRNNNLMEFYPGFCSERFSFYNPDNPSVKTRYNRHSIGIPTKAEVLRECKTFNSPRLLNILSKPPLSPILNSPILLDNLKGNRLSQDKKYLTFSPSKQFHEKAGKDRLMSLVSFSGDLQLSFNEDDIRCQVDYINLDNSKYESLQNELFEADHGTHEIMREEYENKIKMLMVEIADLKYKLEKRVEKEQITSDSNDNYELDIIPSSYRNNKQRQRVSKNSNLNKLELQNLRLSEKLDMTIEKLNNEQAKSSEYFNIIKKLESKNKNCNLEEALNRYKLDERERTRQFLELFLKFRNVIENNEELNKQLEDLKIKYENLKREHENLIKENEGLKIASKPIVSWIRRGIKTLFLIVTFFLWLLIFINFCIIITNTDGKNLLIPVKPNEAYGFIFEVRRLPGQRPI